VKRQKKFQFNLMLRVAADRAPRESRAEARARSTESVLQALSCFWIDVVVVGGKRKPR